MVSVSEGSWGLKQIPLTQRTERYFYEKLELLPFCYRTNTIYVPLYL